MDFLSSLLGRSHLSHSPDSENEDMCSCLSLELSENPALTGMLDLEDMESTHGVSHSSSMTNAREDQLGKGA